MRRYNAVLFILLVASIFSLGFAVYANLFALNGLSPNARASENGHIGVFIEASNETGSPGNQTNQTGGSPGGGDAAGGGGGGGGGGAAAYSPFTVEPSEFTANIVLGQIYEEKLVLKSFATTPIRITLSFTGINNIASVETSEIELAPGETREVILTIRSNELGIYAGKIFFEGANTKKEVTVLVNVNSGSSLFDLFLTLPDSYKLVFPGDLVKAFISIVQVGPAPKTDVTVTYLVKDFEGNTLSSEKETFAVTNKRDYVHDYSTDGLIAGDYVAGVELQYAGGFAASSAHFRVNSKITYLAYALILVVILAIVIFYLKYKKSRAAALGKRKR